jgi:hypothetical protein
MASQQAAGAGERRSGARRLKAKDVGQAGNSVGLDSESSAGGLQHRRTGSISARLFWAAWLVGPATYGAAFVYCWAYPEFCDDPPNVLLAFVLVLTHLAAGAMSVALLFLRGAHWRAIEFWLLLVYWIGIGGWVLPAFSAATRTIDPSIPWLCTRISAVAVVLIPLLGLARSLLTRRHVREQESE